MNHHGKQINHISERFPLPLCAWDGLRYFIVALPEHSIQLILNYEEAETRTQHVFKTDTHADLITYCSQKLKLDSVFRKDVHTR